MLSARDCDALQASDAMSTEIVLVRCLKILMVRLLQPSMTLCSVTLRSEPAKSAFTRVLARCGRASKGDDPDLAPAGASRTSGGCSSFEAREDARSSG